MRKEKKGSEVKIKEKWEGREDNREWKGRKDNGMEEAAYEDNRREGKRKEETGRE